MANASIHYVPKEQIIKSIVDVPDKITLELSIAEAIVVCAAVGAVAGTVLHEGHDVLLRVYLSLDNTLQLGNNSVYQLIDGRPRLNNNAQKTLDEMVKKAKETI